MPSPAGVLSCRPRQDIVMPSPAESSYHAVPGGVYHAASASSHAVLEPECHAVPGRSIVMPSPARVSIMPSPASVLSCRSGRVLSCRPRPCHIRAQSITTMERACSLSRRNLINMFIVSPTRVPHPCTHCRLRSRSMRIQRAVSPSILYPSICVSAASELGNEPTYYHAASGRSIIMPSRQSIIMPSPAMVNRRDGAQSKRNTFSHGEFL